MTERNKYCPISHSPQVAAPQQQQQITLVLFRTDAHVPSMQAYHCTACWVVLLVLVPTKAAIVNNIAWEGKAVTHLTQRLKVSIIMPPTQPRYVKTAGKPAGVQAAGGVSQPGSQDQRRQACSSYRPMNVQINQEHLNSPNTPAPTMPVTEWYMTSCLQTAAAAASGMSNLLHTACTQPTKHARNMFAHMHGSLRLPT